MSCITSVFLQNLLERKAIPFEHAQLFQHIFNVNPKTPSLKLQEIFSSIAQSILKRRPLLCSVFELPLTPFEKTFWATILSCSNTDQIIEEYERILRDISRDTREDLNREKANESLLCLATVHKCSTLIHFLLSGGLSAKSMNRISSHLAAFEGRLCKLLQYIETDPYFIFQGGNIPTPLHFAALEGKEEVIRLSLEKDLSLIPNTERISKDLKIPTPFQLAAVYGQVEVIRAFLERDPDFMENDPHCICKNRKLLILLQLAAIFGQEKIIQLFLEKDPYFVCKLDAVFKEKKIPTLLFLAVIAKELVTAQVLIANGADVNCKGSKENYALHEIILCNEKECDLESILEEANLSALSPSLLRSRKWDSCDKAQMLSMLLDNGANANGKNLIGQTALHIAAEYHQAETIRLLLEKGADPLSKDFENETPLQALFENDGYKGVEEIIPLFLEKDPDLLLKSPEIISPLHWAILDKRLGDSERLEVMRSLLANGFDSNRQDCEGNTPLDLVKSHFWESQTEIIELLVSYGAKSRLVF